MSIRIAITGLLLITCLTLAACGGGADVEPLPDPAPLEEGVALRFAVTRMVDGQPQREELALHGDGHVDYANEASGQAGSQSVGAPGAQHFVTRFVDAGMPSLKAEYRAADGDGACYATLQVDVGGEQHMVQWDCDAAPDALKDPLLELEQFLTVVRASAN